MIGEEKKETRVDKEGRDDREEGGKAGGHRRGKQTQGKRRGVGRKEGRRDT